MGHQGAPVLAGAVGDSGRHVLAARRQQELRRFDAVGGDHVDAAGGAAGAVVRALEADSRDPARGIDLDEMGDMLGGDPSAGALGGGQGRGGVVLGLDRADRDAARIAAACRAAIAVPRIARLRRRPEGEVGAVECPFGAIG